MYFFIYKYVYIHIYIYKYVYIHIKYTPEHEVLLQPLSLRGVRAGVRAIREVKFLKRVSKICMYLCIYALFRIYTSRTAPILYTYMYVCMYICMCIYT